MVYSSSTTFVCSSLPTRGAWIEIFCLSSIISLPHRRSPLGGRGLKLYIMIGMLVHTLSLPTRGAWIEICFVALLAGVRPSRSPLGGRGLKYLIIKPSSALLMSLPTRGAWIEMPCKKYFPAFVLSLPTRGAWIEIPAPIQAPDIRRGRSPLGGRGLKYEIKTSKRIEDWSLPTRGAWIEMLTKKSINYLRKSLPTRGAWIEIKAALYACFMTLGRSPLGGVD